MDSTQQDFDWHQHGVWIMHSPSGEIIMASMADTPYSCRAEALRVINRPWSKLRDEGYKVVGYAPIKPIVIRAQEQVTSNEAKWRYPATGKPEHQPPSGDVWLLTTGGISVTGSWRADAGFVAWTPKPQRDKPLERELGLLQSKP